MNMRIYLVDDDEAIVTMLENIIYDNDIGIVIGKTLDGQIAESEIMTLNPDIVIVDLLMPKIDGIELVKSIKKKNDSIKFIMLSQVISKDMVGDAYKAGIEFFIHKPINVMEVKSVINKAIESIKLKNIIKQISKAVSVEDKVFTGNKTTESIIINDIDKTRNALVDLGIFNEQGGSDILNIISVLIEKRDLSGRKFHKYNIGNIYLELQKKYLREGNMGSNNVRAIEQRVRRTIQQAMDNISTLGIEDFGNYKFEKYSSRLFDFKEIKANMDYIRGKREYKGRVNIKMFIEGLIDIIEDF